MKCLQQGRGRHGHDGRRGMAAKVTADAFQITDVVANDNRIWRHVMVKSIE